MGDGLHPRDSASTEDVFLRSALVDEHTLPDETLLLFDRSSGTSFPLNEVGARIWELCDGSHAVWQIVDRLSLYYDAPKSRIDRDAADFLAALVRHGVLERQPR